MTAPINAEEQQQYFDDYWLGKGGWVPSDSFGADLKRWIDSVVSAADPVLDVGCGNGARYAPTLIQSGVDLYGVDASPHAVAAACANGVKARAANLSQPLPFPNDTFGSAICLEVLQMMFDPEYATREIGRVLKPGGLLLVSVPNVVQWRRRLEVLLQGRFNADGSPLTGKAAPWRDPHIRFFSSWALRQMLCDSGFRVIREGGINTQFLSCVPVVRDITAHPLMRPVAGALERIGSAFPRLLSGRLIAVAQKPEIARGDS